MKNLLLTLGHNSSAILIENDEVKWGYETERLSGLKSDSRFPQVVLDHTNALKDVDMLYVTHWSPDGRLGSMSAKHWNPYAVEGLPIRTLTTEITHHDTHMAAAMAYAGPDFPYDDRTYGLVIDGFGTYGEHLSLYKVDSYGQSKLIKRVHGYGTSLGLMFQYSTAFMGMKMNEDEYKLLGYETHVPWDLIEPLNEAAREAARDWVGRMDSLIYKDKLDPLFSINALSHVKTAVFRMLAEVCHEFKVTDPSSFEGRAILSYFAQALLEFVVIDTLREIKPDYRNLILSGGVFYNVKLNNTLLKTVTGKLCVYPLAGDQGNALGLYAIDHPNFQFPDNLYWGHRKLYAPGYVKHVHHARTWIEASDMMKYCLRKDGLVNLVRGSMEFGPRALCNTSTIALPKREIVAKINAANDRNTVMPMAPVMTERMYMDLYERTQNVWKSHQHMIIAMEHYEHPLEEIMGVAHEYQAPYKHHTGRPQVVSSEDHLMMDLLTTFNSPLINTSFNFHGKPIAFDMESIISNHMMQHARDPSIHTVVLSQ